MRSELRGFQEATIRNTLDGDLKSSQKWDEKVVWVLSLA